METLIRDLLMQLGASLNPPPTHAPCPGISLLGILKQAPGTRSSPTLSAGTHVWHAHDGWAPLDNLEIERWLVDAPNGTHWLLSERPLRLQNQPQRQGIQYDVWGPDRLAQWLGEAVLNGDLNASVPQTSPESVVESEDVERIQTSLKDEGPTALRPLIELEDVLEKYTLTHAEPRPVLLSARIWSVTGILRGPDNAAERQWWQLLEDPFTGHIDHMGSLKTLDFIPKLERIEPSQWVGESDIGPKLASLCEERRHYVVTESSGTNQVQGSVLHWWKLDPSSAEMTPRLALVPAWQIRIPERGVAIVHGLTGELIPIS